MTSYLRDKQEFAERTVVGVLNEIEDLAAVLSDYDSRIHILDQYTNLALASERLGRLVENMRHNFYAPVSHCAHGEARQAEKV